LELLDLGEDVLADAGAVGIGEADALYFLRNNPA